MSHPYEQLADLLDGTLGADDRANVDEHLASCETCRDDLAAATAGREAARGLPTLEPPADLRDRTIAVAGGGDAGASGSPRWYRWAGVAAAALLIGVIAVALPEIGDGGAQRAAIDAASGPTAGQEGAPEGASDGGDLRISDVNYREGDLARLAEGAATRTSAAGALSADAQTTNAGAAAGCVRRAFEEQPRGRLVELIRARFEGQPAYFAVYLEGPGAGEAADTAVVWVASVDSCSVLSFAQARI